MQGCWWQKIDSLPEGKVVTIPGQSDSPPKKWWNFWRFRQKRFVLEVKGRRSVLVYFRSNSGQMMMFRRLVKERHIAVRIGPEDIDFLVTDEYGRVIITNVMSGPHSGTDIAVMNEYAACSRSPKALPYYGENAVVTI